jgi:hypothetical protein
MGTHNNTTNEEITSAIQVLERRDLDLVSDLDLSDYARSESSASWGGGQFEFLRIKSISRSLPERKSDVERHLIEDVLSGIYGLKTPFIYLILGSRLSINVYVGILNTSRVNLPPSLNLDLLSSSLESTFPDIEIEILTKADVESRIIKFFQNCKSYGIMTGIPTAKLGVEEHGIEQIERLIRGLYREEFGYMVIADPVNDGEVINAFDDIANMIMEKSFFMKESRQYTKTSRLSSGGETLNRPVQYYVELLEVLLEKLKLSKAQGMWRTMTYFFSPRPETTRKMSSLLKTVFSGDKSVPEAIRTFILNGSNPSAILSKFKQIELELNYHPSFSSEHPLRKIIRHKFATVLNSRDLATLTHLPKEEMPGYDVKDTARFGVCLPERQVVDSLFIGEIIDRGSGTGNYYGVPIDDFVKHGLIVGVTGSGKTNTCLALLDQLWKGKARKPFLVIEPAKAEYRALLNVAGYEDIQIFTLGDEMISPFRLNPFEIMDGVRLQTHIDKLRAVFNASFIMYAPMPYVLERCIHEVYQDKGWDLTTNLNRLAGGSERSSYGIFPTLTDLYEKIESVVDALGYEDRLKMDIKAGLKARIGSLRIGGKGAMLDTALSIPMKQLLSKPTILELQSIGDDEEKAFIIGLLVARLYEYREVESKRGGSNAGLKHVTLIEEAHRLLSKTSTDFSNLENVSTKAKAVETFCNILSEIRAFGEGILIAEQIPSKLAQDAIKNTNLKIMHRIVSKDDRDLIGHTMNLNEQQNKFISILERGKAAVFSEGFSEPFLVIVPRYGSSVKSVNPKVTSVQDKDISRFMAKKMITLEHVFGRHSGCRQCQYKCAYRDAANHLLSKPLVTKEFTKFLYALMEHADALPSLFPSFRDYVLTDIRQSLQKEEEVNDIMFCFLINAGETYIQNKGRQYGLAQNQIFRLTDAYNGMVNSYFAIPVKTQLSIETEACLKEFQKVLMEILLLERGPFPGCDEFCENRCLFRYDIEPFVKDNSINEKMFQALKGESEIISKKSVRNLCINTAQNLTIKNSKKFVENMALCFFIQKSVQWSVKEVLLNINKWFVVRERNGEMS